MRTARASRTLVVIPARMNSKRFPGKVLKDLGGLPVFEWCRRAAVRAGLGEVVVATDDERVLKAVARFGGTGVLTPKNCQSGTDRAHAAALLLERRLKKRFTAVVNLQGDEPLISAATLRKIARMLANGTRCQAEVATAVVPVRRASELKNPNVVKVALAASGRCLYFSRAPIPHPRQDEPKAPKAWRHIGVYGFKREALERFVRLKPSRLELTESLEQLRALEAGMPIFAARVLDRAVAIDTPADLARARRLINHG